MALWKGGRAGLCRGDAEQRPDGEEEALQRDGEVQGPAGPVKTSAVSWDLRGAVEGGTGCGGAALEKDSSPSLSWWRRHLQEKWAMGWDGATWLSFL